MISQKITIRVLPVDARIDGYLVPRSAFSVYEFVDPDDPTMVAVSTVTSDLIVDAPDDVGRYTDLYNRLLSAGLSPADSIAFLTDVAQLPDRRG